MDESQTGVGGDGDRLATFAYTSPYRTKAVRLVVEHGNHTIQPDRSIIMQPDFTDKCADAAVAAVKMVYGGAEPVPAPKPERKPYPITWKAGDVGPQTLNGKPATAFLYQLTAKKDTTRRVGASSKEPTFGAKIRQGEKVTAIGTVTVDTGKTLQQWYILSDNARVIAGAFEERLPKP